jgi:uncharacterized protein YoxC
MFNNLIQSNVFFFITSIAVVVIGVFLTIALWYVIRILRNVKDVSEIIKKQTIFISGDLSGAKNKIKKLFDSLTKLILRKMKKR